MWSIFGVLLCNGETRGRPFLFFFFSRPNASNMMYPPFWSKPPPGSNFHRRSCSVIVIVDRPLVGCGTGTLSGRRITGSVFFFVCLWWNAGCHRPFCNDKEQTTHLSLSTLVLVLIPFLGTSENVNNNAIAKRVEWVSEWMSCWLVIKVRKKIWTKLFLVEESGSAGLVCSVQEVVVEEGKIKKGLSSSSISKWSWVGWNLSKVGFAGLLSKHTQHITPLYLFFLSFTLAFFVATTFPLSFSFFFILHPSFPLYSLHSLLLSPLHF